MTITLTKDNFKTEVLDSKVPVLVDFWASWCGPCKMMTPIVEEISNQTNDAFKVGKVNADEQSTLAEQYEIMSIPSFFVFKDGNLIKNAIGAMSKDELLELLK